MSGGDEIVSSVYDEHPGPSLADRANLRDQFAPWHHPVKQIVRRMQWAQLTRELLGAREPGERKILRYFTLPGSDLLDVRILSDELSSFGTRIEYFGFNSSSNRTHSDSASFSAEPSLRQAGHITDDAVVLPDRLEDIALPASQAANQLARRQPFDVINIDACDHLGYVPKGRAVSTFDAVEKLLGHQLLNRNPWLLFITTRADPSLLGSPGHKMQKAIHDNIHSSAEFAAALCDCISANPLTLTSALSTAWGAQSPEFLRLFSVGLGKYLLQFFHGQHNLSADVELAAAYCYPVYSHEPDMLSIAFRIKPSPVRVNAPTAGSVSVISPLEPESGIKIAKRATKVWNIGDEVLKPGELQQMAVTETERLLSSIYDVAKWKDWLKNLPSTSRSMSLD